MKLSFSSLLVTFVCIGCAKTPQSIAPTLSESQRLELACEDGDGFACVALGKYFLSRDAVSTRRAERAFESGCDLNFAEACLELGLLHEREVSPSFITAGRKKSRAARHYEQACELGDQDGCQNLGRSLFFESQTPADQSKAIRLLERACDDGHHGGCTDLLRARLAKGLTSSSLLTSRLSVHCRTRKAGGLNQDLLCKRLAIELCPEGDTGEWCAQSQMLASNSIVDNPSCPEHDIPWLVSVIHTHVQSCREHGISQLELHFDGQGKVALHSTGTVVNSCLANRIKPMRILPLATIGECVLKMRF